MILTPQQIYQEFKKKIIDAEVATDLLIYHIENTEEENIRLESIQKMQKIGYTDERIFMLLENLLLSDSNEEIRFEAANVLKSLYQEKALSPLKWALENEKSWVVLIKIVDLISQINNKEAKTVLIDRIWKINNYKVSISLSELFKSKEIEKYNHDKLATIIKNEIIINYLNAELKDFNYAIHYGVVSEIDLSFISEQNVGWKVLKALSDFLSILSQITKINLRSNKLVMLPSSIFSLTSLKYLDLSYNGIFDVPNEISCLTSLEYLNLKHNKLTIIPNSIGSLINLKELNLKLNQLSNLPHTLGKLRCLEVLNLHGNQLNEFPLAIRDLHSLKKLKLGLNNLKSIPEWLKNLHSLKILWIGGNKALSNFNEWITFLPAVDELDLYDNNILALPENINLLKSLKVLKLPNNRLTHLPERFKELSSLKVLDLSWNNLTGIPHWINSFLSLEELNLRGNKLNALPQSMDSLPSLKLLDITLNKEIVHKPFISDLEKKGIKVIK